RALVRSAARPSASSEIAVLRSIWLVLCVVKGLCVARSSMVEKACALTRNSLGLAFEVTCVSFKDGTEVWEHPLRECQHDTREVLLHDEVSRSPVAWPKLKGANALEDSGNTVAPNHGPLCYN